MEVCNRFNEKRGGWKDKKMSKQVNKCMNGRLERCGERVDEEMDRRFGT